MITFYTVLEIQVNENGEQSVIASHTTDENLAKSKYHQILAAAPISDLPYHAGHMFKDDFVEPVFDVYDRREDKTPFWSVIEKQVDGDNVGVIDYKYSRLEQAESVYYQILGAAAISNVPWHTGIIIRNDGIMIEGKKYDRRIEVDNTNNDANEEIVE